MNHRLLMVMGGLLFVGCLPVEADEESPSNESKESIETATMPAIFNANFGMHCTDYYENNWAVGQPYAWSNCDGLWNNLSATRLFYYNLWNKAYYWHDTGDEANNSLESVDLFYSFTHGGTDSTNAYWAMWNDDANIGPPWGSVATSSQMRLGDESRRLSIFATHACHVLEWSNIWAHWGPIFNGGLRIALSSHDTMHPDSTNMGTDFANYLNAGYSFKDAWAISYDNSAYNNQDVAVAATGTSDADCANRRDTMSMSNFNGFQRLGNCSDCTWHTKICRRVWDDI